MSEAILNRPRLSKSQAIELFRRRELEPLAAEARLISDQVFGDDIYLRGLIEYTNHCAVDCLYCGIRRSNENPLRYRLDKDEILSAVREGFDRGLRTFVLQGGEDAWFTTERLADICSAIKEATKGEAALTLSCGIRPRRDYRTLREAGADRYLMRFETSDPHLHKHLRGGVPLAKRLAALEDLRNEGFQLGSGFMVGLPGESDDTVIRNVELCAELGVDMAGVGPFIPHPETPLADAPQEPLEKALFATALLRIFCRETHIPATTAAGSLQKDGRERMIACGANVLMPNLTPVNNKKNYLLYPGKICLDESGLQCVGCLSMRVRTVDRVLSFDRADGRVGTPIGATI
jgi:biotin synthase